MTMRFENDKQMPTPSALLLFLKTLCRCCRAYVAVGPLTSGRTKSEKDVSQSIDFEAFCSEYLSTVELPLSLAKSGSGLHSLRATADTQPWSPKLHNRPTEASDEDDCHPRHLSKWFREFEIEFGLEELLVMACNSSACSAVTSALKSHVKICIDQGATASVCHASWCRLQNFKAVMQLLRQSLVEGEAIALEAALRPLLEQALTSLPLIQKLRIFNLTFLSQRLAARQQFWDLKLQQLDHQRNLVRENARNSVQVAQQSFSPEVLLATWRVKPSPDNLHMQRKLAIARKSCQFNLARKLEEELQILLVNIKCLIN